MIIFNDKHKKFMLKFMLKILFKFMLKKELIKY